MKKIIFSSFLFFALSATASTHEFTCTFDAFKDDGKLLFQITDLNSEAPSYNNTAYTDYEGQEVPFSYEGEKLEWLWMNLLVDFSYGPDSNANKDLILPIDDVGCEVGKIHLFQNTGFKFGYLTIDHNCASGRTYSKVSCSINEVK